MRYKITKMELEDAVKKSKSIASVCRLLNIRPVGGNYKTLKRKFEKWNIDTTHFTGQGWNLGLNFNPRKKVNLDEILVENSNYTNTNRLRKRLICEGLKEYKCECCGLSEWNRKPIPLELNHINGINNDNRIENLEIICPNCHAQTPTYRGRNRLSLISEIKNKKYLKYKDEPHVEIKNENYIKHKDTKPIEILIKNCLVCNNETKNIYCSIECYRESQSKNIPTNTELLEAFRVEKSFSGVGRKYGVSDNAVRKWCKKYGILEMVKNNN